MKEVHRSGESLTHPAASPVKWGRRSSNLVLRKGITPEPKTSPVRLGRRSNNLSEVLQPHLWDEKWGPTSYCRPGGGTYQNSEVLQPHMWDEEGDPSTWSWGGQGNLSEILQPRSLVWGSRDTSRRSLSLTKEIRKEVHRSGKSLTHPAASPVRWGRRSSNLVLRRGVTPEPNTSPVRPGRRSNNLSDVLQPHLWDEKWGPTIYCSPGGGTYQNSEVLQPHMWDEEGDPSTWSWGDKGTSQKSCSPKAWFEGEGILLGGRWASPGRWGRRSIGAGNLLHILQPHQWDEEGRPENWYYQWR